MNVQKSADLDRRPLGYVRSVRTAGHKLNSADVVGLLATSFPAVRTFSSNIDESSARNFLIFPQIVFPVCTTTIWRFDISPDRLSGVYYDIF